MSNITDLKVEDVLLVAVIILLVFLLIQKHWSNRSGDADQPKDIGISSLVEKVSTELRQAEEKQLKANVPTLFKLDRVDLEINFVIKFSDTANAGVKLEPVTVGGQMETSSEKVQKVTLHLVANTQKDYKESSATEKFGQREQFETGDVRPSNSAKRGNQ